MPAKLPGPYLMQINYMSTVFANFRKSDSIFNKCVRKQSLKCLFYLSAISDVGNMMEGKSILFIILQEINRNKYEYYKIKLFFT